MDATIEDANDLLRAAVKMRREAQTAGKPHEEWYDVSQPVTEPRTEDATAEETQHVSRGLSASEVLERFAPETLPAEQLLLDALAVIRDRRPKYGGPLQHFKRTVGMINAAFSDVLKRPLTEADWAIFMTLDKVARYCGPTKTTDGPVDLAGYAACLAEVEASQ